MSALAYDQRLRVADIPQNDEAERAGQTIISALRQAADTAKRNEQRAKAQAVEIARKLQATQSHLKMLEANADAMERRAVEAEQWLMHIFQTAKDTLLNPLLIDR